MMADARNPVYTYHESTKHQLNRYARGPGGLDWATQPNPFRRYVGAPLIILDHVVPGDQPYYEPVFVEGMLSVEPLHRSSLSRLFYDSLALSAWKQAGGVRWPLRVNPSSGNLHPTEGYLVCGPVEGLCEQPMVCHYAPKEHALERRVEFPLEDWKALTDGLPRGITFVGLTTIHWREAWKYGERAFRYCQHDVGHAIASVTLATAAMGWKTTLLEDLSTEGLAYLLGVVDSKGAEPERPECLLAIYPQGERCMRQSIQEEAIVAMKALSWEGRPNRLSPAHVDWPVIDQVAEATRKPVTRSPYEAADFIGKPLVVESATMSFRRIVHQRRSCLALDGRTGLRRDAFYQILQKVIPGPNQFPFSALPWRPLIHLALFIHRVQGLDPGLYFLARDPTQLDLLKKAIKKEFSWERPPACPDRLAFYRLLTGDAREIAQQISCHQEIAADGCFSLGMIAEFETPLRQYGPWFYPRLFWESGVIGQVLYLEAEALGIRSTGIGCFFDDVMHGVLGLSDLRFQDLYHFTVGGPVEDERLMTLPAYTSTQEPLESTG